MRDPREHPVDPSLAASVVHGTKVTELRREVDAIRPRPTERRNRAEDIDLSAYLTGAQFDSADLNLQWVVDQVLQGIVVLHGEDLLTHQLLDLHGVAPLFRRALEPEMLLLKPAFRR